MAGRVAGWAAAAERQMCRGGKSNQVFFFTPRLRAYLCVSPREKCQEAQGGQDSAHFGRWHGSKSCPAVVLATGRPMTHCRSVEANSRL